MAKTSATVNAWFAKANDDLIGAKALWATQNPRVWLLVAFLCQQAAEKALKGFLLYRGRKVQKIHSIEEISKDVVELLPESADLLMQASKLTPYAVQFRYPNAAAEDIIKSDIEEALKLADKVVDEFSSRIPFDTSLGRT